MEDATGGNGGVRDDFADGIFNGEFELAFFVIDDAERARGLSDKRCVRWEHNGDRFADDNLHPLVFKEDRNTVIPSSPSVQI